MAAAQIVPRGTSAAAASGLQRTTKPAQPEEDGHRRRGVPGVPAKTSGGQTTRPRPPAAPSDDAEPKAAPSEPNRRRLRRLAEADDNLPAPSTQAEKAPDPFSLFDRLAVGDPRGLSRDSLRNRIRAVGLEAEHIEFPRDISVQRQLASVIKPRRPAIVFVDRNHWVVVDRIENGVVGILDPAGGRAYDMKWDNFAERIKPVRGKNRPPIALSVR